MAELGTVKSFDDGRGWGYVGRDNGAADAYVHHSNINAEGFRTLSAGDRVRFEIVEAPRGPQAMDVTKVSEDDREAVERRAPPRREGERRRLRDRGSPDDL